MNVIIGYDGSECARAALADLARAGLPEDTHALVVTAAEPLSEAQMALCAPMMGAVAGEESLSNLPKLAGGRLKDAGLLAQNAATCLHQSCPQWVVEWEATEETPANRIISAASEHQADLIVVGSRGHSVLRRLLAGSVSQRVMRSAACSVRGVHERAEHASGPLRLIVAFDPSEMSQAVVRQVAGRQWPAGTVMCLLTVRARHYAGALERGAGGTSGWEGADGAALGLLEAAGYKAEQMARHGDAARLILEEAQEWGADCIFVSPRAFGTTGRARVSTAVRNVFAAAPCTVEVVRS